MLQRAVVRVLRLPQRRPRRGRGAAPPGSSAARRWRRAVAHARGERRAGARRDLANLRLVGVGVRAGIRASLRARVGVRVRVRVGVGLGLGLGLGLRLARGAAPSSSCASTRSARSRLQAQGSASS